VFGVWVWDVGSGVWGFGVWGLGFCGSPPGNDGFRHLLVDIPTPIFEKAVRVGGDLQLCLVDIPQPARRPRRLLSASCLVSARFSQHVGSALHSTFELAPHRGTPVGVTLWTAARWVPGYLHIPHYPASKVKCKGRW